VKEGDGARGAVADAGRRTTSRRELARHERFEQISPEVGELDTDAFEELLDEDPDAALALLADLNGATDERLRDLARRLAGRVVVEIARFGPVPRRGVGRLTRARASGAEGDIDLDPSLDAILLGRASRSRIDADDLVVSTWRRPSIAVCLLVDRSGSMHGERLAAAAVAAAAVVYRNGADCSVVAFAEDAVVVKAQHESRTAEEVVGDLLRLRGFGVTNVALAARVARQQLDRSTAGRRITVLLSDCRVTAGGDAVPDAAALAELVVIAPEDDAADARAFADAVGSRWTTLSGPSSVPTALAEVLRD